MQRYRRLGGVVATGLMSLACVFAMQQSQVSLTLQAAYTGTLSVTGSGMTGVVITGEEWMAHTGTQLSLETLSGVLYELIVIDDSTNTTIATGVMTSTGSVLLPVQWGSSGIYTYQVRMIYLGQPATTNTVTVYIDQDPPYDVGPVVVEQVYNTSTETSSWSFRRPQAHDIHTVVAYYTLRIYDEYGALIYTIQLSQREVYLDDALLPPGSYSVSLTATDLVGNESSEIGQYFTIETETAGSSSGGGQSSGGGWTKPTIETDDTTDDNTSDDSNTTTDTATDTTSPTDTSGGEYIDAGDSPDAVIDTSEDGAIYEGEGENNTNTETAIDTTSPDPVIVDITQTESNTPIIIWEDGQYAYHAAAPEAEQRYRIRTTSNPPTGGCVWTWLWVIGEAIVIGYLRRILLFILYTKKSHQKFDR